MGRMGDVEAVASRRDRGRRRRVDADPACPVLAPEVLYIYVSPMDSDLFAERDTGCAMWYFRGGSFCGFWFAGAIQDSLPRSPLAGSRHARTLLRRGVWDVDRSKFPGARLLLHAISRFPPRVPEARHIAKDPTREELVISERLIDFEVDLVTIDGLLKPVLNSPRAPLLLAGQ